MSYSDPPPIPPTRYIDMSVVARTSEPFFSKDIVLPERNIPLMQVIEQIRQLYALGITDVWREAGGTGMRNMELFDLGKAGIYFLKHPYDEKPRKTKELLDMISKLIEKGSSLERAAKGPRTIPEFKARFEKICKDFEKCKTAIESRAVASPPPAAPAAGHVGGEARRPVADAAHGGGGGGGGGAGKEDRHAAHATPPRAPIVRVVAGDRAVPAHPAAPAARPRVAEARGGSGGGGRGDSGGSGHGAASGGGIAPPKVPASHAAGLETLRDSILQEEIRLFEDMLQKFFNNEYETKISDIRAKISAGPSAVFDEMAKLMNTIEQKHANLTDGLDSKRKEKFSRTKAFFQERWPKKLSELGGENGPELAKFLGHVVEKRRDPPGGVYAGAPAFARAHGCTPEGRTPRIAHGGGLDHRR